MFFEGALKSEDTDGYGWQWWDEVIGHDYDETMI